MGVDVGFKQFLFSGEISSDCREENGITIGLIDGIIAQIRVLRERDISPREVREALRDLADDEDFDWLCRKVNRL